MHAKRLLIAVDESAASERAVHYVADIAGSDGIRGIVLFHVLPPLPPELLEHSGEREARDHLREEQARYKAQAEDAQAGLLRDFKVQLVTSGAADESIQLQTTSSVGDYELGDLIVSAARAYECDTVVLGRESFSGLRKRLHHHIADALVRHSAGLCTWVVS